MAVWVFLCSGAAPYWWYWLFNSPHQHHGLALSQWLMDVWVLVMAQTWHSGHRPPPSRRTRWGIYSRETEETCGSRISRALNAQRIAQYLSLGLIGILLPRYQPAQHSWSNIQRWIRIFLGISTVLWNYFLVVLPVFNVFSQPFLCIIGNNMRSKAGKRMMDSWSQVSKFRALQFFRGKLLLVFWHRRR